MLATKSTNLIVSHKVVLLWSVCMNFESPCSSSAGACSSGEFL